MSTPSGLLRAALKLWVLMVSITCAVALICSVLGVSVANGSVEIGNSLSTVLVITAANAFQAIVPLVLLLVASGKRGNSKRVLAVLATLIFVKNPLVVGVFAANDAEWLWQSSRWWTLEYAAIAIGFATGHLLDPKDDADTVKAELKGSLSLIIGVLLLGAFIEVYTA